MLLKNDFGFKDAFRDVTRTILELRTRKLTAEEKTGPRDLVSEADRRAEQILAQHIGTRLPEDGIRGEEGTARPSRSGYEWICDPIDGTTNFLAELPFFGISAGRVNAAGVPEFGAIGLPAFAGSFYFASRGGGAFDYYGRRLDSKQPSRLRDAVIAFGTTQEYEWAFSPLRRRVRNLLAFGSFVYEASLVFRGYLGGYVHTGPTVFDAAGTIVIAREMVCVVGCPDGREIDLSGEKIPAPLIIAASQEIFDGIAEVLTGKWK